VNSLVFVSRSEQELIKNCPMHLMREEIAVFPYTFVCPGFLFIHDVYPSKRSLEKRGRSSVTS